MWGGRTRILAVAVLAAAALSGCGRSVPGTPVAAPGTGPVVPELRGVPGEWVGSYTCAQGETGLTLTVEPDGRTEFAFYPLVTNGAARPGRFEMRATVDGERVTFTRVRWLEHPSGYEMVDLVATERTQQLMRGTVNGSGCSSFRVDRILS
ncbi:hypothetical protein AB0H71_32515 [Nocardia sp. NPDC050697]|uniref:hypothetical protein n=1 Tax=Nocardia sp. NPDC050697 TaxID=3155158 RepID=UPI0033F6DA2A